jgi:hypothetical protein
MATLPQEKEMQKQLKDTLDELAKINAASLVHKELGSDLNFESGVVFFLTHFAYISCAL